jgi:hypothetical protein
MHLLDKETLKMRPTRPITPFVPNRIKLSSAVITGLALVLTIALVHPSNQVQAQTLANALTVQVEASQGFAAPGNSLPANFLVVVSDSSGAPVTSLDQSDFSISNQFKLPGQTCGFSNNIVSFVNVLNGAYRIQVDLVLALPGCTWVEGDYLTLVAVTDGVRRGQAPTTLSVKCPNVCSH